MKQIKLYIDSKIVDLNYSNLELILTKQITDYQDITKRFGNFSYSFNIPRTKNNINIFKYVNELDTKNKFKKSKDFKCELYVNDNLIIDGVYVLTSINETNFIGNITIKINELFNLIGEKTLQDLKLPELDYEGVLMNYDNTNTTGSIYNFNKGSDYNLNKELCFDTLSLLTGYKDPDYGLLGSTIDYREYYSSALLNYSNQNNGFEYDNRTIGNFSLYDIMPRIRFNKVLEQIFKDIGYQVFIQNTLLANDNILIPYFGDEDPELNWKHLSKCSVVTDSVFIADEVEDGIFDTAYWGNDYNSRKVCPLIFSGFNMLIYDYDSGHNTYEPQNFIKNVNTQVSSGVPTNLFTNYKINLNSNDNLFNALFKRNSTLPNGIGADKIKLHYTPTNKLLNDNNNNFNIAGLAPVLGASRDSGWLYTAPVEGEYEFDIQNFHDLRVFTNFNTPGVKIPNMAYMNENVLKTKMNMWTYTGFGDIDYTNYEHLYYQNLVIFAKVGNEDNIYNYLNTFNANQFTSQGVPFPNARNCKYLNNFVEDDIIAFYSPMLRDLHSGDINRTLEDYFDINRSILKNNQTYNIDDTTRQEYFGFNSYTQIENFDNKIFSGLNNNLEYSKKLVKLNKNGFKGIFRKINNNSSYNIDVAQASGLVDFKFKTKLNKGDQIRMYYITYNLLEDYASNQNAPVYPFNQEYNFLNTTNGTRTFPYLTPYGDLYTDNMKVTKMNIKLTDNNPYSDKLKLANFLPKISQKDFLIDYIKTNNLYFEINTNNRTIVFQKKDDFLKIKNPKDYTNNIDTKNITIKPPELYKQTNFGYKTYDKDDLSDKLAISNPIKKYELSNNIYLKNSILDNTSTLFYTSEKKRFKYYKPAMTNINGFYQLGGSSLGVDVDLINFTEDGDGYIKNINSTEFTFNRKPRLILQSDDNYIQITENTAHSLINNIDFEGYEKFKINLPDLYYSNETIYNELINDRYLNIEDSAIVEYDIYLNEYEFSKIDLKKSININNTIYLIQSIEKYNVLQNSLCKLTLLKI